MVNAHAARWIAVTLALSSVVVAQQPGTLRGVVRDRDLDAPLPGAQVLVVETGQRATTTDQGNYVCERVKPGTYTLVFSKDGYVRQVKADVVVTEGRLTQVDADLAGDVTDMEELLVQDTLQLTNVSELDLLKIRFDNPALLDSISSELMNRAGASDAASALRLVAGATVQGGKTPVIRGLPDRYVSSQMNGVRLPSVDENKRAVELDQFPASIIDSIQVSKTFTPDQQGDASGGAVNLQLKSIPNEPAFLRINAQTSYNPQVSHRDDFLSYDGGGIHHGGRGIQYDNIGGNWDGAAGTSTRESPVDYKASLATGGKFEIADGVRLGGFATFFNERSSSFYKNGQDNSYWVEDPGAAMTPHTYQGTVQQGDFKTALYDVTRSKQTWRAGALATVGLETDHHAISLTYLYTMIAEDAATLATDTRGKQYFFPGYDPGNPATPGHSEPGAAPYTRLETLDYTERSSTTLQLHGRHTAEKDADGNNLGPVLDWTIAHSTADLYEPDKRQFAEVWSPGQVIPPFVIPPSHAGYKPSENFNLGNFQRIWKDIGEESEQYFANLKFPFEQWSGDKGYLKFGVFHDQVSRDFNQETFSNFGDNSTSDGPFEVPWSRNFPHENHPITASTYDVDYRGHQQIDATYAMIDLPLSSWLEVVGGVRLERTSIGIVNLPEENATWFPPGSLTQTELHPGEADVDFHQSDALPSIAMSLKPIEHLTLRGAINHTVARQTFKELTPILQQEYVGGPTFVGNPALKMSALQNYDLRLDYAPYDGGLFSVSWFLKRIDRPIEYVQRVATFDYTTAVNYPSGTLNGYEFEVRQSLGHFVGALDGVNVGANLTFIDSEVILPADEAAGFAAPGIQAPMPRRDMTNAPDHLYNMFLTWDIGATGTQFAAFYTVTGDSLIAGAGEAAGNFVPNLYAKEFDNLNLSLSQSLGKNIRLTLAAKNVTDPTITEVYRSPYLSGDVTKTSYTKGVEYVLGIGGAFTF